MNIFKLFLFLILSISLFQCKSEKQSKLVFSDEVNQYNYLDKPHNFKHVYDFENVFTKAEYDKLYSKLTKINQDKKTTILLITEPKGSKEIYIESTKNIHNIFLRNHNLDKSVIIRFSKNSREVAISSSNNLEHVLNDSVCKNIIDNILIPNFKIDNYYDGVNNAIDSIVKKH